MSQVIPLKVTLNHDARNVFYHVDLNICFLDSHSTLTIKDLREVLDDLKKGGFSDKSYYDLGLELGLYSCTLDIIRSDNPGCESHLRECISKWLQRVDDVEKIGGANWITLCNAVEKKNRTAADYIS